LGRRLAERFDRRDHGMAAGGKRQIPHLLRAC
jgi:hypothetical protein